MIDISEKFNTLRYARAQGILETKPEIIEKVRQRLVPKGDVLQVARAAGIAAAKRSADWIVFCHPIPLDWVELKFDLHERKIVVSGEVRSSWKTGVEMEAMTAVSAALLNMYDMLKPLTEELVFGQIKLVEKTGGKSDFIDKLDRTISAAVLVISDSTFEGKRKDKSGKIIQEYLLKKGLDVRVYDILPDIQDSIRERMRHLVDQEKIDLVFSTGGTGLGPKDITPEATIEIAQKVVPGIAEAIRRHGKERTPYAMLSRELVALRGQSLIINLPGSSKGAKESLDALFPGLLHAFPMIWGKGHNH